MTAVVLARGTGRRMQAPDPAAALSPAQQAAAAQGHKALMPVGDDGTRPFLDYVLSGLADAGCTDVVLVVGPGASPVATRYTDDVRPSRLRVHIAVQPEADGTARAVLAAASLLGTAPFLVLNADNLYPLSALRALVALSDPGVPAFRRSALVASGHIPETRIAAFALLEADAHGMLARIVEKPAPDVLAAAGPDPLVSMNLWRFDARILDACRDVPHSSRGEHELPQAVQLAIDRGLRLAVVPAEGPVLDLSSRGDVVDVGRRLAGVTVAL